MAFRLGPAGERILQGIILAMAGLVASAGVTFGCAVRNVIFNPEEFARNFETPQSGQGSGDPSVVAGEAHGVLMGMDLPSLSFTIVPLLLMVAWLWAVYRFARAEPRSPLTLLLVLLMAAGFVTSSFATWQMAYPVCNPF